MMTTTSSKRQVRFYNRDFLILVFPPTSISGLITQCINHNDFLTSILGLTVLKYGLPQLAARPFVPMIATFAAGLLGFAGGVSFNHELCMRRLMQLEDSPIADLLRKKRGLPVLPKRELEGDAPVRASSRQRRGDYGDDMDEMDANTDPSSTSTPRPTTHSRRPYNFSANRFHFRRTG